MNQRLIGGEGIRVRDGIGCEMREGSGRMGRMWREAMEWGGVEGRRIRGFRQVRGFWVTSDSDWMRLHDTLKLPVLM